MDCRWEVRGGDGQLRQWACLAFCAGRFGWLVLSSLNVENIKSSSLWFMVELSCKSCAVTLLGPCTFFHFKVPDDFKQEDTLTMKNYIDTSLGVVIFNICWWRKKVLIIMSLIVSNGEHMLENCVVYIQSDDFILALILRTSLLSRLPSNSVAISGPGAWHGLLATVALRLQQCDQNVDPKASVACTLLCLWTPPYLFLQDDE